MLSQLPDVAQLGHHALLDLAGWRLGWQLGRRGQHEFDLAGVEAGQAHVESHAGQFGEFRRQHAVVPLALLGNLVVRDAVRAALGSRQSCPEDDRDFCHSKLLGGLVGAVPGQYLVVLIHDDGLGPAHRLDAGHDLVDLVGVVLPAVLVAGFDLAD